jgi:hypothetical protein
MFEKAFLPPKNKAIMKHKANSNDELSTQAPGGSHYNKNL